MFVRLDDSDSLPSSALQTIMQCLFPCSSIHKIHTTLYDQPAQPPKTPAQKRNSSNENPPLALNRQLNKSATTATAPATLAVSRIAQRHVVQSIIIVVVTVIVRISLPTR